MGTGWPFPQCHLLPALCSTEMQPSFSRSCKALPAIASQSRLLPSDLRRLLSSRFPAQSGSPLLSKLLSARPSEAVCLGLLIIPYCFLFITLFTIWNDLVCLWVGLLIGCLPTLLLVYLPYLKPCPAQSRCVINTCQMIGLSVIDMACFLDPVPFKFPVCFHLLGTIHPSPRYVPPTKSKPKAFCLRSPFRHKAACKYYVQVLCKYSWPLNHMGLNYVSTCTRIISPIDACSSKVNSALFKGQLCGWGSACAKGRLDFTRTFDCSGGLCP